jgi:aminoglycoside 3-N-acetyltransferase
MAHTQNSLQKDLSALGIKPGATLLVHSSYKSLGTVEGGPKTVISALRESLGPAGTLMAPAFTNNLIDPYTWPNPPKANERLKILEDLPPFDPELSEPYQMGAIPKTLWKMPGVIRSDHPVTSWLGIGPKAEMMLQDQSLDAPEGIQSPIGKVYQDPSEAQILLLGVEHSANTSIHLAEHLLDMAHLYELPDRFVRLEDGLRVWREVKQTTKCSDGFVKLTPHTKTITTIGKVGDATAMLMQARALVQIAMEVLQEDPTALLCESASCVHCPTSRRVLMKQA